MVGVNKHQPIYLGIFEGHYDPSVALVQGGRVIAYAEEERHLRNKHAYNIYPYRALQYCLDVAGVNLGEIAAVGINWDLDGFSNGRIANFFDQLSEEYPVDTNTKNWQKMMLGRLNHASYSKHHEKFWRRQYGDISFPKLHSVPHHYTHAFQACRQSPFASSICLTIDGSGDTNCTALWRHHRDKIEVLREINMPHSLGWVYAAFTEYLGFRAYDGEYKVMGLAAYGRPNPDIQKLVDQIVTPDRDAIGYRVDPTYIHYGAHTYSDRYTDKLAELFGRKPRLPHEELTTWHEDVAYAVQQNLEEAVERLVRWGIRETGIKNVCISGGVGLNIKMNSRIFQMAEVDDVFINPLCSDGGAAIGAALVADHELSGSQPEPLPTLDLGFAETNENIEHVLRLAKLDYQRSDNICADVAKELAQGHIVGWFQGRMEAGPRALGHRSILADPRDTKNRDKVNAIIKFREYWRPFCPSMKKEAAAKYFEEHTDAPYMVLAFRANDVLKKDAPAIVHVDGTSRVQLVDREYEPRFYQLLDYFENETGVPVLLNTSFNIKGEPIVCTVHDALRTFFATGLEVLAIEDFIIRKPRLS